MRRGRNRAAFSQRDTAIWGLVSITGAADEEMSFSVDTDMGECLVVGRKSVGGGSARATFVILNKRPPIQMLGAGIATQIRGVVARIVTGPRDANRQDPHLPMRYDTGRPRAVIPLRISQPRTTSLPCPAGLRARRPAPMMDVYRKKALSTRP